jgi:hypothetical protein
MSAYLVKGMQNATEKMGAKHEMIKSLPRKAEGVRLQTLQGQFSLFFAHNSYKLLRNCETKS